MTRRVRNVYRYLAGSHPRLQVKPIGVEEAIRNMLEAIEDGCDREQAIRAAVNTIEARG